MTRQKKYITAIIALLVVIVLAVFTMPENSPPEDAADTLNSTAANPQTPDSTDKLYEDYPRLPKDHRFVEQSASQIIERFNQGTGVIFLGFKECPWCQRFAPMVNQAAEAEGIEKVYYFDIKQASEYDPASYSQIVSIIAPYLQKDVNGQPRVITPDVSVVWNGEIIGRHEQETANEDEQTPETYWTPERVDRAVEKMREFMRTIK